MYTFKANYKYNLLFFLSGFLSLVCLTLGGVEAMSGNFMTGVLLLLPVIIVFYFLLYVIAEEVTVKENTLIFKTKMSSLDIDYNDIKDIKTFFSSKSLLWHSGDKEKSTMLCAIILKERPLRFLLFGNEINDYKELHSLIDNKRGKADRI